MRNLRLDLCYDGTRYRGWQRLPNTDNTIQGKLERALSRILEEPIEVTGSGRTDAGVHAMHQVANFHCSSQMSCGEILNQLRRYLPEDVGIYSCKDVSERFHARLNAKSKTYRYRLWNSSKPCVFERRYVTVYESPLDLDMMRQAAAMLIGTHDFSAFCANKHMKKSTVRTIHTLDITQCGDEIHFTVTGNGFLHNMVRILVGTLVEVGSGEREVDGIPDLFGAEHCKAGKLMDPEGLCLMEVVY
ncbi:MAG: tRNA pseudouridine(38-40) synthase TruA [Oscillospiraceae bacterium]|nr:tRNA pseudouridine(38-40) synthase TruA [Oscillospiraceae bacterium]